MRKKIRFFKNLLVFVSGIMMFSMPLLAQFSGNIQGVISDQSGAPIPEASVQLRNVDTGIKGSTTTSSSGNYRFSSLGPGLYVITTEARGFRTTEVELTLSTSEIKGINMTLPVASVTETVNVVAQAPAVATDDSRIQVTLGAGTVRDLPALNRNIYDVLAVAPGVTGTGTRAPGQSPAGGADNFGTQTPNLSANGRSTTGNSSFVDGMDATGNIINGNFVFCPNPDSIQEVSLQTNSYDGENNLSSSILIKMTTKSGTNQYHGTGSYLFNNENLLARSRFTTTDYTPFKRQDLSATLGGPIIKGKTFFFANVESLWSTSSTASSIQTFEAPEFINWAQQNFPNTVGTQVLNEWPLTSTVSTGTAQTALTYFGVDADNNPLCGTPATANIPCDLPMIASGNMRASPFYNALQYNFRVDQYFGTKDRLFGSYAINSFDQEAPSPRKGLGAMNVMDNRYAQANWTHTFSSTLLNEIGFAGYKISGTMGTGGDFRVPQLYVTGQSIGFTGGWGPGTYGAHNYNWREVLTWVRGKHTLKFGFNGTHSDDSGDFTPVSGRPSFIFNNLLDLVQDRPYYEFGASYNPLTGQAGPVVFGGQVTPWGLFVQDDWKVRSNLSFTLVLRGDTYGNHTKYGEDFEYSNLLLGSGSTFNERIADASVQTVSSVFAQSMSNNWNPRIGFAWDPSKHGSWVIRGGIGVYHDWVQLGQSVDMLRNNPPGVVSPVFSVNTAIKPLFALAPNSTPPYNFPLPTIPTTGLDAHGGLLGVQSAIVGIDRNLTAPLAVNYTIGVEHEILRDLVVGANYSGSRGYNQLTATDMNRSAGGLALANGTLALTRLNPSFGSMNYIHNGNDTSYNAMVLTLRRTAGAWATFQGSYTFSHTMDYGESGTRFNQDAGYDIPDQNAYSKYWADANWDIRHRFSFSGVATPPGVKKGWAKPLTSGWQLSTIAAIQTGSPFWVINNLPFNPVCEVGGVAGSCSDPNATITGLNSSSGDYNADGLNYDIPNTPSTDYSGSHNRLSYINGLFTPADFQDNLPAVGTEGNLKRNSYRNPGLIQVDVSVQKNNHLPWLGDKGNLQFRFDFLNVLNRVNLADVNRFMADGSNFGKSTSTLSPRQIQLGVRISF